MKKHKHFLSYFILWLEFILSSVSYAGGNFNRRTPVVISVESAGPAVVNINTTKVISNAGTPFSYFRDPFIDEFFKDFFPPQSFTKKSLGSGVIINPKGYILTNQHVIARASVITVTLINNKEYNARLIGADMRSDIAVIKIDAKEDLPFVPMHTSNDLFIGETVIAIGNPFGLSHTVTTGIISALNRSVKGEGGRVYSDFIQVDASINPGNSGGPLLNINGELIGINTAIYQKAEGIGFAIPIDRAKRIVDDLITYGEVKEAWLGIFVQEVTPRLSSYFKYEGKTGVIITKVFPKSPAYISGLKVGDIIMYVGKKRIQNMDDYQDQIISYSVNDTLKLTVFRGGKESVYYIKATLIPDDLADEIGMQWLGIRVADITRKLIRKFSLFTDTGVMITKVDRKSNIFSIGVRAGDVLRQINKSEINNKKDFSKAVLSARKNRSAILLIQRGKQGYYITLEP